VTDKFSAADIVVCLWLASAMVKCGLSTTPEKVSAWIVLVLGGLKSYSNDIAPLIVSVVGESVAPCGEDDFTDNLLINTLKEFGLEYDVYLHPASMTAEELVTNVPLPSGKETHTKNLFFKDKKHGLVLVTHATASTMNTKQLATALNLEGKVNLRLTDEATLDQYLKVQKGCVGPLCIINDTSKEVQLVLDKTLTDGTYDYIHSHPLRNDVSVKLTPAVLMEFFSKTGIEPVVADFSASDPAPEEGASAPSNKASESKAEKGGNQEKKGPASSGQQQKKTAKKGETLLALQWKKSENFANWYSDVIVLSEMIAYYDISGCYILRPWSYKVWDLMQQWFNQKVCTRNVGLLFPFNFLAICDVELVLTLKQ
jgi:prolyl-tRNA synthetase